MKRPKTQAKSKELGPTRRLKDPRDIKISDDIRKKPAIKVNGEDIADAMLTAEVETVKLTPAQRKQADNLPKEAKAKARDKEIQAELDRLRRDLTATTNRLKVLDPKSIRPYIDTAAAQLEELRTRMGGLLAMTTIITETSFLARGMGFSDEQLAQLHRALVWCMDYYDEAWWQNGYRTRKLGNMLHFFMNLNVPEMNATLAERVEALVYQ